MDERDFVCLLRKPEDLPASVFFINVPRVRALGSQARDRIYAAAGGESVIPFAFYDMASWCSSAGTGIFCGSRSATER